MNGLNKLLANFAVLNQKAYNMHWNVEGHEFMSTHKMTEKLYEKLTEFVDRVAEKIRMMSGTPYSTMTEYLTNSDIKEIKPRRFTYQQISEIVVADLTVLEKSALAVKTSATIQPLLDDIFLMIDKERWLFRSMV